MEGWKLKEDIVLSWGAEGLGQYFRGGGQGGTDIFNRIFLNYVLVNLWDFDKKKWGGDIPEGRRRLNKA